MLFEGSNDEAVDTCLECDVARQQYLSSARTSTHSAQKSHHRSVYKVNKGLFVDNTGF